MSTFYFGDPNAPLPNRPNHIGVNAIIVYNNNILLEKRRDNNSWGLIGGGVKIDESLEDALIREVSEETSIKLENFSFFNIYSDPSRIVKHPDGNILRIISVVYTSILLKVPNISISDESLDIDFFSLKDIENMKIVLTHEQILKDYFKDEYK